MTSNAELPEKSNSSTLDSKGILEKYELVKLNKYAVISMITIINLATWMVIFRIRDFWFVDGQINIVGFTLIMLGMTIGLFTILFLYFNQKTNFLIDERNKRLA